MRSSIVGRADELRRLRHLLGSRGVALISGPSGVGKTALCDTLIDEYIERDASTHELRGVQGLRDVPFGALTLSLQVEPGETESETLRRVVGKLKTNVPVLAVIDDCHLLDGRSAGLVSGLAQVSDVDVIVVVTSGEVVSDDITSIWARWPECRIDVEPLGRTDVGDMLQNLWDRDVSDHEIEMIATQTLGYPLYVTALAAELSGTDSTGDVESLIAGGVGSDRLTHLMERRLGRLDRPHRELFDVVGFAESTSETIALGDRPSQLLDELESSGLVRRSGDRVQAAHPLLGSVSRGTLTGEGRRRIAGQLLAALDEESDGADVAAIVRQALAESVVPPPDLLVRAGEVALASRDYGGLARLIAAAPTDPHVTVLKARAARYLGESTATEIPVGLDDDELTEFLSGTSQGIAYAERRFSDAIRFLRDGMSSVVGASNRNRLALELMVLSGLVGDIDALLGAARAVSSHADPDTRMLAMSATQLAEALTLATAASDDTYARARELSEVEDVDDYLVEQLEMSRVMVELAEGRFEAARTRADSFNSKTLLGSWQTIEAVLADAWMPVEEAGQLADSAVAALEQFDPLANLAQARIVAELRKAQMGVVPTAEDASIREPGVAVIDEIMNRRVDAWLAWSEGDPIAGKLLVEVGREAIALGHRLWGLSALFDAVRLGHGEDVQADIDHLVITRGAGFAVLAGRHARAATQAGFWDVARHWWQAGAPNFAIEAAITAGSEDDADVLGIHLMARQGATPLVGESGDMPSPISNRQLEIADRALSGQTNEMIAEELFLSRRTVENHLYRVYSDLAIDDGRDGFIHRFGWIYA